MTTPDDDAAEAHAGRTAGAETVDLGDADAMKKWMDHFGITEEQLRESVKAAGTSPQAIKEHLLNQGASAGPS